MVVERRSTRPRARSGGFKDLFSTRAACYARARPTYPPELFAYLAGLAPGRELAWDCGTGNGQAAIGLASHFDRVIATDASAAQLAYATPHRRVEYRLVPAEEPGLDSGTVDLVTVAQALHWFDLDAFYREVRRVSRPGGVIAVWCYTLPRAAPPIDAACRRFHDDVVGPYWESGRRYVDQRYETIPFPFEEFAAADWSRDRAGAAASEAGSGSSDERARGAHTRFECRAQWTLAQYMDYLSSWSAVQRSWETQDCNALDEIKCDLSTAWGDASRQCQVTWPIHLRVGRIEREAGASGRSRKE